MEFFRKLFRGSEVNGATTGAIHEALDPTDRDLELAALKNLSGMPYSSQFAPQPDDVLDRNQQWIDEKRIWANTLEDRRVRKAYLGWIDFAQTRLNENRKENRTHENRNAFESRQRGYESECSRAATLAARIPKP